MDARPVQQMHMRRLMQRSPTWKQSKAPAKERMRRISNLDLDQIVVFWVIEGGIKVSTR